MISYSYTCMLLECSSFKAYGEVEFYGSLCAFTTMRQPLIHSTNGAWKPKCVRDRNLDPGSGSKKVWDELLCGHVHATYVRISVCVCVCVFVCFPTVPARRQCAKVISSASSPGWLATVCLGCTKSAIRLPHNG